MLQKKNVLTAKFNKISGYGVQQRSHEASKKRFAHADNPRQKYSKSNREVITN
jgi:hypothetical protein